ncbi:membrane protein [Longimycelium tulufanense]|uniref:Membrane protein n=1 Tax=Longimycelium tulufanense TaxID=907463 RepID=A0A8J3FTS6_9PSEU|nr:M56 family metallopeptidase [Longimycelium tulufanense]GGM48907.1 membrane protein [Longimycelium tulufanense]
MIIALVLLGCGLALASCGQHLIQPVTAPARPPLWGMVTWLVAEVSAVSCWMLGGLLLAWPELLIPDELREFFAACIPFLRQTVSSPYWTMHVIGVGVTCAAATRLLWCLTTTLVDTGRRRSRHAEAVRLVGRTNPSLACVVVDEGPAIAYTVPGRPPLVVLTRATLRLLPPEQLAAVLVHERTHLAEYHHIPTDLARGLARAFRLPLFAVGAATVPALLEMRADEAAARQHGRRTVAAALLSLAGERTTQPAAFPGGAPITTRLHRLLTAPKPWSTWLRTHGQPLLYSLTVGLGPYCTAAVFLILAAGIHLVVCPDPGTA